MSNMDNPKKLLNLIRGIHQTSWVTDARVLATHSGMDSSHWTLGLVNSLEHPELARQVKSLAKLQKYPNPFFEPAMLKPAVKHLANGEMSYLFLSERVGRHETLRLFAPARFEKTRLTRRPVLRIWTHMYAPLGHPLIDRRESGLTLGALVNCLHNPAGRELPVLLLDDIPLETDFFQNLYAAPALSQNLFRFSVCERAAFIPTHGMSHDEEHMSSKRRQRFRVAMKRLHQHHGRVEFDRAYEPADTAVALEELLKLEARSWKGRRGTAILQNEADAAYARESIAQLSAEGRCSIFSMKVGGKLASSVVVFETDGTCFSWKTTFDEQLSRYSVGNLLINEMNQLLSLNPAFHYLDSLADHNNQTANRMWPHRRQLCSIAIGMGDDGSKRARTVMKDLVIERKARSIARRLLRR